MDIQNKIKGAIYGIAVGDAMGAPWEGWRPKMIFDKFAVIKDMMQFDQAWALGEFTDDTWLTLATARAYDDGQFNPQKAGESMVIWQRAIGKGIGRLTNAALSNLGSGRCDIYTAGKKALASHTITNRGASNGSLMKCISTGLVHTSERKDFIIKESTILSEITHADPKCVASCVGYNIVAAGLLEGRPLTVLLREAQETTKDISEETSEVFDYVANGESSRFNPDVMQGIGYVLRALDRALIAVRDAVSFEDEMIKVINEGGDTDTNAAIAGGLLGVRFGFDEIPERWVEPLLEKDELDDAIGIIETYRSKDDFSWILEGKRQG